MSNEEQNYPSLSAQRPGETYPIIMLPLFLPLAGMEQSRYVPSLALAFHIARVFEAGIEDIFEYVE